VDDDPSLDPRAGLLVGDVDHRTRLLQPLSSGSFGDVYVGELEETEGRVAVKLERQKTGGSEQLLYEGNVYRRLEDGPGIARLHWFGLHPAGLNVSSRVSLSCRQSVDCNCSQWVHCNRTDNNNALTVSYCVWSGALCCLRWL